MLKQLSWPFYSSDSIRKQIKSTSRYFTAVDLLQGYHQVPLHEDNRDIHPFIMAQGRFRFKSTSMGLINSGDFFNQITDSTIQDLQGIMKSVNNCLTQAETLNDLFTRCREFSITLSKKKFQLGRSIRFGGFRINEEHNNEVRILPDSVKINQ